MDKVLLRNVLVVMVSLLAIFPYIRSAWLPTFPNKKDSKGLALYHSLFTKIPSVPHFQKAKKPKDRPLNKRTALDTFPKQNHKLRQDIVVRYYKEKSDGNKVNILTENGYYLHIRPLALKNRNCMCNNIHYGGHFPLQDLQRIATLLIQQGMPIKRIIPFQNYWGWKKHAIEISCDTSLSSLSNLQIASLKKLTLGDTLLEGN